VFSTTTLSIKGLNVKLGISDTQHNNALPLRWVSQLDNISTRPLFDGIDSEAVDPSGLGERSDTECGDKSDPKSFESGAEKSKLPLTFERLPNGWSKKAVKHTSGKWRQGPML